MCMCSYVSVCAYGVSGVDISALQVHLRCTAVVQSSITALHVAHCNGGIVQSSTTCSTL